MSIVKVAYDRTYTFPVMVLLTLIVGPVVILRTSSDVFINIDTSEIGVASTYTGLTLAEKPEISRL
jgi:hypothetical protein